MGFGSLGPNSFPEDCWVQLLPAACFRVYLRKKRRESVRNSQAFVILLAAYPGIQKIPLRHVVKVWILSSIV